MIDRMCKGKSQRLYRYINGKKTLKDFHLKNAQSDLEKAENLARFHFRIGQAEEFNGHLTDVFNINKHSQVYFLDRSASFMDNICVSKKGVIKLLNVLNRLKALLHPRVLIS